jgi:SAM-dependent methyltransferase
MGVAPIRIACEGTRMQKASNSVTVSGDDLLLELAPRSLFGSVSDEAWLWLLTNGEDSCPWLGRYLPTAPASKAGLSMVDSTLEAALVTGFHIYRRFLDAYQKHGGQTGEGRVALDFGCGWGRVTRFFLREFEPSGLWGCDISEQALEVASGTNRWATFVPTPGRPPTAFPSGMFDLIYANSVFSHLNEQTHLSWLGEFKRILRPGGLLLATTLRRSFIEDAAGWRDSDPGTLKPFQKSAAETFGDTGRWLAAYDAGHFCFGSAGPGLNSEYGFACIPARYVRERWSEYLNVLDYVSGRKARGHGQDLIVAKR